MAESGLPPLPAADRARLRRLSKRWLKVIGGVDASLKRLGYDPPPYRRRRLSKRNEGPRFADMHRESSAVKAAVEQLARAHRLAHDEAVDDEVTHAG